jgi:hypothetical protein
MNNDSSWAGRHDSPLDLAIDRAVRDMMQVDPAPGLRRRVLSQLQRPSAQRPQLALRFGWMAGAVAIVLATLIYTSSRSTAPATVNPASSQATTVPQPAPDADVGIPPVAIVAPTAPRVRPRGTHEAIAMPRVANVFEPSRRAAAAAATTESGDIIWPTPAAVPPDSGALAPLVIAPLTAAPIETAPIVIAPLQTAAPKGGQ